MKKLKPRTKSEQAEAITSVEAAENARQERREDKIMEDFDFDDDEDDDIITNGVGDDE